MKRYMEEYFDALAAADGDTKQALRILNQRHFEAVQENARLSQNACYDNRGQRARKIKTLERAIKHAEG